MSWLVWLKQFAHKYLGGHYFDGSNIYYDDILEFDPLTGQWELLDRMIQPRRYHAVSVVDFQDFRTLCLNWFELFYNLTICYEMYTTYKGKYKIASLWS